MGRTIKTSFCSRVTFSMRSPVAMSNGCPPVLASYSAINLFTSSMSAVAGSYSRSVVSPRKENVRILAFMFDLLRDVHVWSTVGVESEGLGPYMSYCTVFRRCQDCVLAFSRCGWGLRHGSAVAYLLVVQEMRVGGACFTSFSKTKVNGIRNSGRTDRGENPRCPLARARSQRYGSRR